jgi:hypothetical protein
MLLRHHLLAALLPAIALTIAACSGSGHATPTSTARTTPTVTPVPSPTAVPFLLIPVDTPTRRAAVANVRACRAADLKGVFEKGSGATGGQLIAGAVIGNRSTTPCRLDLPIVHLIGPSGNPLTTVPAGAGRDPTCNTPDTPFCIASESLLLLPSTGQFPPTVSTPGLAGLHFSYWSEGPGGVPCTKRQIATVVRLTLPAGAGTFDLPTAPDFPWGLVVCGPSIDIIWFAAS